MSDLESLRDAFASASHIEPCKVILVLIVSCSVYFDHVILK